MSKLLFFFRLNCIECSIIWTHGIIANMIEMNWNNWNICWLFYVLLNCIFKIKIDRFCMWTICNLSLCIFTAFVIQLWKLGYHCQSSWVHTKSMWRSITLASFISSWNGTWIDVNVTVSIFFYSCWVHLCFYWHDVIFHWHKHMTWLTRCHISLT